MKITVTEKAKADLIIIPLTENFDIRKFPKSISSYLEEHKESGLFKGKKLSTLEMNGKQNFLFIGLGKEPDDDVMRKASAIAAKHAKKIRADTFAFSLKPYSGFSQPVIEGAILGLYEFTEYKRRKKDDPKDPSEMMLITKEKVDLRTSKIIADGVLLVRDLVNRPASDKPPTKVVEEAKRLGEKYGFSVKSLGKKELEKLGLNSLLAVNRGSDKEPQLCILELNPKSKDKPVALVGKGVTFDAGGLQVKPDKYMNDMKSDMAGAATVLGIITTLARLKSDKHVVGVMGLVENMLGPDAYKPNDILKAYNGKTIEVIHTDAEGRLVLADALSYVDKNYKPKEIIDFATLTGSCLFALGYRVAAVMGNDEALIERIKDSSKSTDELVWQLPLYNHYKEMMKGSITDLRNLHKSPGQYGPGAITAGAFLSEFVHKNTPWAHIDIAGTAFSAERTEYVPEGGTGWGVRLMVDLILDED